MRAKVLVVYGTHRPGDIIDVFEFGMGYRLNRPLDAMAGNYFHANELEILPLVPLDQSTATMRTFDTGATRHTDAGKLDYEGFLSPLVLERYAQYLNKHRVQADGQFRDSDNWQKGIPKSTYIKSAFRHFVDFWKMHRTTPTPTVNSEAFEDSMMAVLFNVMGYAHEYLKGNNNAK